MLVIAADDLMKKKSILIGHYLLPIVKAFSFLQTAG
jgi:hypothetical protein